MSETTFPGLHTKAVPGPAPNGMGTGLFASTDIETGEDALNIEFPFSAVLDTPRLEDTCSGCFGKRQLERERLRDDLRRCTGCGIVRYCDKTCQAKDWKTAHSLECSIFKNLKPRILPNNARAVLRIALRTERQKYKPQELDFFSRLETHIREIRDRNQAQWERITLSSKAIKAYTGTELKVEVLTSFFAKLDLNSFNLTNALYDRIGVYMHPYAALINHSCDFNSIAGFDGDVMHVKAIRPIKKDDQIFTSYVDATNPSKVRRTELSERYYFDCQCAKCAQGPDGREDMFLTTPQDLSGVESVERQANEIIESASSCEPVEAIQRLESAMTLLRQTSIWPITRQPYVSLRDELITNLLSAGRFNAAFIQTAVRYLRIDPVVFQYEPHPVRQIHAWSLAKLAIHVSQGVELNLGDADIRRFELDFGFIIWSVLNDLVVKESQGCTVPSFKRLVRSTFNQVHGQFVANGLNPKDMGDRIQEEWAKVEKVVQESLKE